MICGSPASFKTFKKWFAGGPQASKPLKSGLREARKLQNFKKVICGSPASNKTFKKRFAGGPQATKPLKNDLQITILLLHQKDKLKNKIKQDHVKWFYRPTLYDYNRASLNEPKGNHFRWVFPPLRSKWHPTKFVFFAF